MNLDDITAYTSALEAITVAVEDLSPELAAEALRFVLRVVEPEVVPRALPAPRVVEPEVVPRALPAPRVVEPEVVPSAEPIDELVAEKLVAQGWDYPSAVAAAAAAMVRIGPGAESVKDLVETAKHCGKPKRRTPKEARAMGPSGHVKIRRRAILDDAVAFVGRFPDGAKTADYAAKCGLTASAARHRLNAAAKAGLVRLEGSTRAARWFLTKKAAA